MTWVESLLLEVSSFSAVWESTTRRELAACSGICMKLNLTYRVRIQLAARESCARACQGLPDWLWWDWRRHNPARKDSCCQHLLSDTWESGACCLKTKGGGEPGLPSPLCLSHGPAQVPGRCEAPRSHKGVTREVCLTTSLANRRLRGPLVRFSIPSWKRGGGWG